MSQPTHRSRSFRRSVFKKLDRLYQIPFIPDTGAALMSLSLMHAKQREDLLEYWEGRVPNAALCQAMSAMKDRFRAMCKEVQRR